jgi:putative ABC transport system permease protein
MRGLPLGGRLTAVLRLAWRDAWRNRGRSALVAVMVATPVLVLAAASVVWRSDQLEPRDVVTRDLGDVAQAKVMVIGDPGSEVSQEVMGDGYGMSGDVGEISAVEAERRLRAAAPPRDRLLLDRSSFVERSLRVDGRVVSATLRELAYTDPGLRGLVRQASGRAPAAPGEVVVSQGMAREDGIRPGDTIELTGTSGARRDRVTVVGVVEGIGLVGRPTLFARPGELFGETVKPVTSLYDQGDVSWFVVGPVGIDWTRVEALNELGIVAVSRAVAQNPPETGTDGYADPGPSWTDIGTVGLAVGMAVLQVVLLAGPAIAVGARRNERTLALVAASGAPPRAVRSVVLTSGAVVGLVGCTIAAVGGAAIGAVIVPALRRFGGQQLVRVDVHITDLVGLVFAGALTAVVASLVPARAVTRLDLVATLTGRRVTARRGRVSVLGLIVFLGGLAVMVVGVRQRWQVVTLGGIAAAEMGLVILTGTVVAMIARVAGRLPFSPRFALRDAARQRGRTAPAVAAIMAAVAASVASAVYFVSDDAFQAQRYQGTGVPGTVLQNGFARDSPPSPERLAEIASELRRALPVRAVAVSYTPAVGFGDTEDGTAVWLERRDAPGATGLGSEGGARQDLVRSTGLFDDGTATAVVTGHADPRVPALLQAGTAIVYEPDLLWPDGTVRVQIETRVGDRSRSRTVPLPARLLERGPGRPGVVDGVLPRVAAQTLGIKLVPNDVVASTSRMPTPVEEAEAGRATGDGQGCCLRIERGFESSYRLALLVLVVAAGLITLAGTFTAVGLAVTESRPDLSTLAAVGASPGIRRRIAAAQAGVLTGIGSGLGLVAGLVVGWAMVRLQDPVRAGEVWEGRFLGDSDTSRVVIGWHTVIPWPVVLGIVVGLPLLASLIGWATVRSRLTLVRRPGQ